CLLEALRDRGRVDRCARRRLRAEDLDRDGAVVEAHDVVALREDLETHVLEDLRRDVERNRSAARVHGELDARCVVALTELELAAARTVREPCDAMDVFGGLLGRHVFLVTRGVAVREAIHERERLILRQLRKQRLTQSILPASDRFTDFELERIEVGLERLTPVRRHRDDDARERRLRQPYLGLDVDTVKPAQQDLLDAVARAARVLIPRQVHEAAIEPAERIPAREEPHAPSLLQREDAVRDPREILERRLEEIVARERIDDVLQRLAAVALRIDAWQRASGGNVSMLCCSVLPRWLFGSTPDSSISCCTLRRSSGMSRGSSLYADDVKSPRKRRSAHGSPRESKTLTLT